MSLYQFLQSFRPDFQSIEISKLVIPECKSILDVGCGSNSSLKFFKDKIQYSVGVDIFKPYIDIAKKKKIHNQYIVDDVNNIDKHFKPKSFDCVMAIGLVEHLPKKTALNLISKMEKIATKIIIIGTPNGWVPQEEYEGNSYQIHKCAFSINDFTKKGYKVIGMDGPKSLRGETGKIELKPTIFFSIIVNIIDPLLRSFPSLSFNLLAYKIMSIKRKNYPHPAGVR